MKKIFFIILVLLTTTNISMFSQEDKQLFSVSIDSIKIEGHNFLDKYLKCFITIENTCLETIEFYNKSPFMGGGNEFNDWNMILKKNCEIPIGWDDSRYEVYYEPGSTFMIEENSKTQKILIIPVSSMLLLGSRDNLSGNYTGLLELSNARTTEILRQTIKSNIVEFELAQ